MPSCSMPVVLDRREDKDCDTGKFELAYKQVYTCTLREKKPLRVCFVAIIAAWIIV